LALAMEGQPAVETLERAYMELLDVDDKERAAEAQSTIGWLQASAGDLEQASLADARALELVEELPASRVKALVLSNAGSHLVFKPEYRARGLRLLRECLEVARTRGLWPFLSEAHARRLVAAHGTRLDRILGRARRPEDLAKLMPWARLWEKSTAGAFLGAYRETAGRAEYLPDNPGDFRQLLRAYLLEKALSELLYEMNNRPAWIRIPLQGILSLPV